MKERVAQTVPEGGCYVEWEADHELTQDEMAKALHFITAMCGNGWTFNLSFENPKSRYCFEYDKPPRVRARLTLYELDAEGNVVGVLKKTGAMSHSIGEAIVALYLYATGQI